MLKIRRVYDALQDFRAENDYSNLSDEEHRKLYNTYNSVKKRQIKEYINQFHILRLEIYERIIELVDEWQYNREKRYIQTLDDDELDADDIIFIGLLLTAINSLMEKHDYEWAMKTAYEDAVDTYFKKLNDEIVRRGGKPLPETLKPVFDIRREPVHTWVEKYTLPALKTVGEKHRPVFEAILREGYRKGWSIDKIAKLMKNSVQPGSSMDKVGWIYERIARTEVAYITEQAKLDTWRSGGIYKVMHVTRRDSRVCHLCRPRDGLVYNIDEIGPDEEIPVHSHCRCTFIPIFEGNMFLPIVIPHFPFETD
jgi:SPP1 gp7 family putative phage head morphogenesis protein